MRGCHREDEVCPFNLVLEVKWADLILTMTSSHKLAILQQYSQVSQKVYTLKEYSGEGFIRMSSTRTAELLPCTKKPFVN